MSIPTAPIFPASPEKAPFRLLAPPDVKASYHERRAERRATFALPGLMQVSDNEDDERDHATPGVDQFSCPAQDLPLVPRELFYPSLRLRLSSIRDEIVGAPPIASFEEATSALAEGDAAALNAADAAMEGACTGSTQEGKAAEEEDTDVLLLTSAFERPFGEPTFRAPFGAPVLKRQKAFARDNEEGPCKRLRA